MTLIQNLPNSTTTISSYVVRRIVASFLAVAGTIAVGFVVATRSATVLTLVSSMTLTSYAVVLVVALGAISLLGARQHSVDGKKQTFDVR